MSKRRPKPARTTASTSTAKQRAEQKKQYLAQQQAERLERSLRQAQSAPPADRAETYQDAVAFVRTAPPQLAEWFWLPGLLEDLARAYADLGRTDDALATAQEAIDAGLRGSPDIRCVLAEINYRAGRREQADRIWAEVRAQTPEDVWLYNHAGLEKHHGAQHDQAVDWLASGLALAIDAGDPEHLVAQMADARATSLRALGLPDDNAQQQADAFLTATAADHGVTASHPDPAGGPAPTPDQTPDQSPPAKASRMRLAVAWFPAEDYPAALARWPELAQAGGPAARGRSHAEYNRAIQAHLVDLRATAPAGGVELVIAPVHLAAFDTWCTANAQDPATSAARAAYAAEQARTSPDVLAWPPTPGQDCWCGSTRPYASCCAPTP